ALILLIALWGTAIVTSKITRPRTVSDPVDRATAARAADAISRATAFDHPLPTAYALSDPLLPTWTDVLDDYARCRDALGRPLACDAPPLPGDVAFFGHRTDREWLVE